MSFVDIFGNKKTRVPRLSCGVVCVILRLAVSVEHRLVTDKQTDRHMTTAYTALAWRTVKVSLHHLAKLSPSESCGQMVCFSAQPCTSVNKRSEHVKDARTRPTYGCSSAAEQIAVRLREIERETVAADAFRLHPRRTPRVRAQPLQHGIVIAVRQ